MAKRSDTNTAIANLMKWAERPEWAEHRRSVFDQHVAGACKRLGVAPRALLGELADSGHLGMVFGVAFEDFAARRFGDDDVNVVDDYLRRRGWHESFRGRLYLQGLRDSLLSLYEVVGVVPGKHVDVVDLVRGGDRLRVHEKLGSEQFVLWDRIGARVVDVEGRKLFGGGLLLFDREAADALLRVLNGTRKRLAKLLLKGKEKAPGGEDGLAALVLRQSSYAFSETWVMFAHHALHRPPPQLVNSDGEEILFAETRLPLRGKAPGTVAASLDGSPIWERCEDDPPTWQWLGEPSQGLPGGGQAILGTVELRDDALAFTANSRERVERGCAALATLLGDRVGAPLTVFRSVDETEDGAWAHDEHDPNGEPGAVLSQADRQRLTAAWKDDHYRKTLEEPVPALGGKSPRQCVKTRRGKEDVVAWLKLLENHELRAAAARGIRPYDLGWMWRELGLGELHPE